MITNAGCCSKGCKVHEVISINSIGQVPASLLGCPSHHHGWCVLVHEQWRQRKLRWLGVKVLSESGHGSGW